MIVYIRFLFAYRSILVPKGGIVKASVAGGVVQWIEGHAQVNRKFAEALADKIIPAFMA